MSIKKDGVNIGFAHLTYKARSGILRKTEKKILDDITGAFRAGELSCIIGPSGSGKTTLLNILSGLAKNEYEGTLKVDESNYKSLRHKSCYIMPNQMLHPLLTIREAVIFAIKFNSGTIRVSAQHEHRCDDILKQLGLTSSANTLTKDLSGGEKKRLSIAIELVRDPEVLFLDEPTTGLDSSSSTQFIRLLSELAKSGKSIICSIHTPSALMFQAFDHVYAIAEGRCIYQGSSGNILPFLAEMDLFCPESYNPADYLMEIATNQYGNFNQMLTEKINNGLSEGYRSELKLEDSEPYTANEKHFNHESRFTNELILLIQRNFLFMKRNLSYTFIRLIVAIIMAIVVGVLFYDLGHLANHIMDNYKFVYNITQFLTYSSFFSLLVRFPTDFPILRTEYFNGWYSSLSYYLALTIADLPVLLGVTFAFTFISYYMTGQPMEDNRLLLILLLGIICSLVAQSFGLFASSICSDITITLVIGGVLMAFHMIFSGVLVLKKDVQPWIKWIFDIVFLNHANDGMVLALFGNDREKMDCEDIYCHYRDPKKFLKLIDAPANISFHSLLMIFLIVHAFTYVIMTMKLKRINIFA